MAIYETTTRTSSCVSHSSPLALRVVMALVLSGPQQLLLPVTKQRDPYARGSNAHDLSWIATLQASISLTLWCLGLIVAVSGKGKYLKYNAKRYRRGGILDTTTTLPKEEDSVTVVSRVMVTFFRKLVRQTYQRCTAKQTTTAAAAAQEDDLTITTHSGSCQCGAVQFQVVYYMQ
jgi:hypothetical protein